MITIHLYKKKYLYIRCQGEKVKYLTITGWETNTLWIHFALTKIVVKIKTYIVCITKVFIQSVTISSIWVLKCGLTIVISIVLLCNLLSSGCYVIYLLDTHLKNYSTICQVLLSIRIISFIIFLIVKTFS